MKKKSVLIACASLLLTGCTTTVTSSSSSAQSSSTPVASTPAPSTPAPSTPSPTSPVSTQSTPSSTSASISSSTPISTPSTPSSTPVSTSSTPVSTPSTPSSTPSSSIAPDPLEKVSVSEALEHLRSSRYSGKYTVDENIGLSHLSQVGIDQEKYESQEKYPVPQEGTVYNAEDINVTPDASNNSGTLNMFIANTLKNVEGVKIIKFKANTTYRFTNPINISGLNDIYFVGDNTTLLYEGWGTYFDASLCNNVHINGIRFDMKYSPTIAGTIKRVNEGDSQTVVTLDIPEEFNLSNELYSQWTINDFGSYMECYYDAASGRYVPDRNKNLIYNSPTSNSNKGMLAMTYNSAARELDVTLRRAFGYNTYKTPQVGTKVSVAYTMYDNHGFHFLKCNNVYLEDVECNVSGGMGFRVELGKNFNLNRFRFMPKTGSERIMTATADIVHTIGLEGELNITNSTLEASHDDALNIKSFYTNIASITASSREIVVQQTQTEAAIHFEVGEQIEIYNPSNMERVATYTIVDVEQSGTSYTLKVNARPKADYVGYSLSNASKATKMTLDNCYIGNKRNRGILLQARNSTISNCTFQNVVMGGIQVLGVYDVFREAIMPKDIQIFNNKFITNWNDLSVFAYGSIGAKVASTIEGVSIYNNFFYNGVGTSLSVSAAGQVLLEDNLFHYEGKTPGTLISVDTTNGIEITSNKYIGPQASSVQLIAVQTGVTGLTENDNEKEER